MDDLIRPIVVAPMAGGPTTTALVTGAAGAGALGFLAAGYRTPEAVEEELRAVRGVPFGLNIFVPMPPPPDVGALERYRAMLRPEAERFQVDLPPLRLHDDDGFGAKVALAEAYAVPLVSFTFGVPERAVVARLQRAGSRVLLTVTNADEARRALAVDPDGLVAQAGAAGAHSATTDPAHFRGDSTATEILAQVRALTGKPVLVAGGVMTAAEVATLIGRARGLANRFVETYSAHAPIGYPAVHHLTAPIRAAAAKLGDAGSLNLWAGTGHALARTGSVADLVGRLMP